IVRFPPTASLFPYTTLFRSDVYRWLLGLRWPQFAAFVGSVYVGLNLLFAALYSLGHNSIAGTTTHGFLDCFFFSVQTLATVGYRSEEHTSELQSRVDLVCRL